MILRQKIYENLLFPTYYLSSVTPRYGVEEANRYYHHSVLFLNSHKVTAQAFLPVGEINICTFVTSISVYENAAFFPSINPGKVNTSTNINHHTILSNNFRIQVHIFIFYTFYIIIQDFLYQYFFILNINFVLSVDSRKQEQQMILIMLYKNTL